MSDSLQPHATCQPSLSLTIAWSLPKFMFIASVMLSSHRILWHPLLLLPSIFPSIRDFSSELSICIRWPEYWSFSISPFRRGSLREHHWHIYPAMCKINNQWEAAVSTQGAQLGALWQPRGVEWGGRGGSFMREETYVYLCLIHMVVWQKPMQYCKPIIYQLNIKKKLKKLCFYTL